MDLPVTIYIDAGWFIVRSYLIVGLMAGIVVNRLLWLMGGGGVSLLNDVFDSIIWAIVVGVVLIVATHKLGYSYNSLDMMYGIPVIGIITVIIGTTTMLWSRSQLAA